MRKYVIDEYIEKELTKYQALWYTTLDIVPQTGFIIESTFLHPFI